MSRMTPSGRHGFESSNLGNAVPSGSSVFVRDAKAVAVQQKIDEEHQKLVQQKIAERLGHGQEPQPKPITFGVDGTKPVEPWADTVARMLANRKSNAASLQELRKQAESETEPVKAPEQNYEI